MLIVSSMWNNNVKTNKYNNKCMRVARVKQPRDQPLGGPVDE